MKPSLMNYSLKDELPFKHAHLKSSKGGVIMQFLNGITHSQALNRKTHSFNYMPAHGKSTYPPTTNNLSHKKECDVTTCDCT